MEKRESIGKTDETIDDPFLYQLARHIVNGYDYKISETGVYSVTRRSFVDYLLWNVEVMIMYNINPATL